ncbi:MAG: EAL domain-containing protein [Desulfovibrio sp.]|nr:EAL domain-containing protein [Desulfovibrio sp.]
MDTNRYQFLDDTFLAFSMLAETHFVTLYDTQLKLSRYSPAAVKIFNLPGEYVEDGMHSWEQFIHPEDRSRFVSTTQKLMNGTLLSYDLTYRCKIWDGSYSLFRFIGAVIRDHEGKPGLIGGLIINEGRLELTDSTTMLNNKDSFFKDLAALKHANQPCCILLLGINELTELNRKYTYSFGNLVLQQVAWLIQEAVGTQGVVYRMEGKRFAILSKELNEKGMRRLYKHITKQLRIGVHVGETRQTLSTSGGIFQVRDYSLSEHLIYDCLQSVYKDSRFFQDGALVPFSLSDTDHTENLLSVLEHIRYAMSDDCAHFYLEYQPVLAKNSKTVVGFEALLRFKEQSTGFVPTKTYITILEQDFAFEELGIWILRQTMLETLPILAKHPNLIIGVNIAHTQIRDVFFPESLSLLLEQTGFPPNRLVLELNAQCRNLPLTTIEHRAKAIVETGVRLCLDDFGVGNFALEILQNIPVQLLKIDAQLLRSSCTTEMAKNDLHNLCSIGTSHNTRVCLKCIETQAMEKAVNDVAFDYAQGFAFAYPMKADHILTYLNTQ